MNQKSLVKGKKTEWLKKVVLNLDQHDKNAQKEES